LSVSYCNWLWLRKIVQEGVNKSNHPIQNPVIINDGAINSWQYCHVLGGVRDLETGFGLMTGFVAHLYNFLLHFTNHYVFSSPSSSTAASRDSHNSNSASLGSSL
jgi:hypothetical protein